MEAADPPWAVGQGPRPTIGNAIEFLIDNEAAWRRLAVEIGAASHSVRAMLFMLDAPHVRMSFDEPVISNPGARGSVRLEERLLAAAHRGVDVAVLINHVLPTFSPANTTRAIEGYFRRHDPAGRVRIARLTTPQSAPIHAKVFVIDDRIAFLIGSPFAQEYFDGRGHRIDDPRRGHLRWRSLVKAPIHDVSARIEGPAVGDLDATFRLHWQHARTDDALARVEPARPADPADPAVHRRAAPGGTALQVTRTLHGARYAGLPEGETGVFESYLRALQSARHLVYLENQYFTCVEVVDALVDALLRRPTLQMIALINMKPDIAGYLEWQAEAVERLFAGLGDEAHRAAVFTLWGHEAGSGPIGRAGRTTLLRTHVHSKVAIVDDDWLTVGSANLDGVSLLAGEHALRSPFVSRIGRLVGAFGGGDPNLARATEVNVTVAALPGEPPPAEIDRLRRELWAEHLGYGVTDEAAEAPALRTAPAGGWLSLWRERADQKLDGLRADEPRVTEARILPFPYVGGRVPAGIDRPEAYLRALGVDPERIDVRDRFRSFSFREGRWK